MLQFGARGSQVKVVQSYLNLTLPPARKLKVDGIWGPKTDQALRETEGVSQVDRSLLNRMKRIVSANLPGQPSHSSASAFKSRKRKSSSVASKIGLVLFGLSLAGLGVTLVITTPHGSGRKA